jgi:hypothetical protein
MQDSWKRRCSLLFKKSGRISGNTLFSNRMEPLRTITPGSASYSVILSLSGSEDAGFWSGHPAHRTCHRQTSFFGDTSKIVFAHAPSSLDELKQLITDEFNRIPQEMVARACRSVKERCQLCCFLEGKQLELHKERS